MNKELIRHMYDKATDVCIAKAEKDNSLAWRFEEEYARVIVEECIKVVEDCTYYREDTTKKLVNHFGIES